MPTAVPPDRSATASLPPPAPSWWRSATVRWSLLGAAFGVCFPFKAAAIRWAQTGWDGALAALQTDPLLWIICSAPVFLGLFAGVGGRKQDQVSALNAGLEKTVADRTAALAAALRRVDTARADQATLLAALEVGLVSFDRTGTLSAARSAALERMLPGSAAVTELGALLQRFAGVDPETTEMVCELLWDEVFWSPFEDTVAMIQCRFEVGERVLETHFRPVRGAYDALDGVMLQVLDCTAAARAEQEQAQTAARVERLGRAARSVSAFLQFRSEMDALFRACGDQADPTHRRPIHTLKGNARIFAFQQVADGLHAAEDALEEHQTADLAPIRRLFQTQAADVAAVLGVAGRPDTIEVDRHGLESLAADLPAPFASRLRELEARPAAEALRHHAEAAERLAELCGQQVDVQIAGCRVFERERSALNEALTHVLTNAVVHGAVADRILHIRVEVRRSDRLCICIEDDGPGLDAQALRQRAIEQGRWTAEEAAAAPLAAVWELVFATGLSTHATVTAAAGRGVGLAAAREGLERIGGSLRVRSTAGAGTCFELSGPALADAELPTPATGAQRAAPPRDSPDQRRART